MREREGIPIYMGKYLFLEIFYMVPWPILYWGIAQEGMRRQRFTHFIAHPAHKAYAPKFLDAVENLIILDYNPLYGKYLE
ncbi:hypothetical protein AMTRI_Chr09g42780 [Amborella trichopoda]